MASKGDVVVDVPKSGSIGAPPVLVELSFEDFIDATAWSSDTVVMLQAFSDASEIDGVFCVAGVAFGIERAKKAHKAWRKLYGDRIAHMTDMHAREGQFKGIDDDEADRLCRASVEIIKRYASKIAVVSCDIEHVETLAPRDTKSVELPLLDDLIVSAYNCCTHWMMYSMGGLARARGERSVQYYFETGDEYQGVARRFLAEISKPDAKPIKDGYCHSSDVFASKQDVALLQTADMVAWEWAKNVKRIRRNQPLRGSLKALMDGRLEPRTLQYGSDARYARHFSREELERFFRKIGALMRATSHAEVVAAMNGSPS